MENEITYNIKHKKILYFVHFSLIYLSLDPWPFWEIKPIINLFLTLILLLICIPQNKILFDKKNNNTVILILYSIIILWNSRFTFTPQIGFNILLFALFIYLKDVYKSELLKTYIKYFALINLPSIIGWILYLLNIPFPISYNVEYSVYSYTNYYLYLFNNSFTNLILPRYSGIIIEPGHLSMICAFLLFINDFNIKNKYNLILTVCLIFTFSLSGYVIYFVGYLFKKIWIEKRFKLLLNFATISATTVILAINYNEGENALNTLIISRLEYEDGDIKGNNRNEIGFDEYFKNNIQEMALLCGIGEEEWSNIPYVNCSYKSYIGGNGVISLGLLILLYILISCNGITIKGKILLFLFAISFLQRPYALMRYELFTFILAIDFFKLKEIENQEQNMDI